MSNLIFWLGPSPPLSSNPVTKCSMYRQITVMRQVHRVTTFSIKHTRTTSN